MKFTEEQLKEIERARARLDAWRNTFQFYPSIPEEEHSETHTPEPEFVKRQWDIVNQLRGEMRFLSSKVNELRAKASPLPSPNYIYSSIKEDDSLDKSEAE